MIAFSSEQQNNHCNRRESPGCPSLFLSFTFKSIRYEVNNLVSTSRGV